jgi:hypothetical protein
VERTNDRVIVNADLAYNKASGELVDYVNLDSVSNEILKFYNNVNNNAQLAEYLLVAMIRCVTTSLYKALAANASKIICNKFTVWHHMKVHSMLIH